MELKITTLIENMPDEEGTLLAEHGLSLYIEFQGRKILFDTGQTGDFIKNAEKLGIVLADLDYIMISHGHYDHSGGLIPLTAVLDRCTNLYCGEGFFDKKYKKLSDGTYRYNGNHFDRKDLPREKLNLHMVSEDITPLTEDLLLFTNFQRVSDFEALNEKFVLEKNGGYVVDEFKDEMALGIRTSKGLVLVVGCSHVGISNILQTVKERTKEPIYAVLGGTHLMEADETRLERTMQAFRECQVACIAVSHCTGEQGIVCAGQEFGESFILNNTGNVFEV